MFSSLLTFIALAISWVVLRIVRPLFISSPLDNIPGPASTSTIRGNLSQLYSRFGWDFLNDMGTKYNKVVRFHGLFGRRILYVYDPTALHQMVIKEPDVYAHPEHAFDTINMTLGPGLLGVHGARHRKQRKMLNPVFSIKHMREITPIFYDIAHKLSSGLEAEVGNATTTVNILDWLGRTALELIGQGGLGRSLDNLEKPEPNALGDAVKEFLPRLFQASEFQSLAKYLKKFGSASFRSKLIDILPLGELKELKRVVMKMHTESINILAEKRAALKAGDDAMVRAMGEGKDIMSILLRANMAASEEDRLLEEELLGQMNLLILGGTDTTSNALTTTLDILGRMPDVQDKLRAEIVEAQEQYGQDIPYDALVALPYMDAICREILRLYPPASIMARQARKDMVMPISEPITGNDRNVMKEIFVPAGTEMVIGILPINRDKAIWGEDAEEFKPERWMSSLPSSVIDARIPGVYANLMTFNGGGRACIGFKFSQLEMKVVLATLLSKFQVTLADNADEVCWNLAAVRYPTVGKESDRPEYPIKLTPIKA